MSVKYHISRLVRFFGGHTRHHTCALILAAGSGSRMSDRNMPKQFLALDGAPVLAHTLLAFEKSRYIDEIIVVVKNEYSSLVRQIAQDYKITKFTHTVEGGAQRSDSVLNGMTAVQEKTGFVAIHDAARCLVTSAQIDEVVSCAYAYTAASAGSPVKDTVKRVGSNGFIIETPERSQMWNAATPQVFRAPMYRAAAISAAKEGFACTDDNMIMEHIGQRVKMVDTGYENIKITTDIDLVVAEAILQKRKNQQKEELSEKQKKNKKRRA